MKIDKEFKALIFPLADEEYSLLEKNVVRDGCRDALVIWKEEDVLLDGHNRYEICTKHKIEFKEKRISLPDRTAALDWIDSNQLGRRNLSPDMMRLVRGRLYNRTKKETPGKPAGTILGQNEPISTAQKIARASGVSAATVKRDAAFAKEVEKKPELMRAIRDRVPVKMVVKEKRKETDAIELKKAHEKLSEESKISFSKICDIRHCSMKELFASGIKPDCIITDPPYPEKFIPVYEELAELAKNIPLIAVMCGQSYLPEIMAAMTKHLSYRWTLAYLTPGGQAVQQWKAKVNTFWKPILLFGKSSDWIGDVCKSDVNDNDKRFHGWGQSESGMADLVDRLSKPGHLICDPFVGGGTTAIVTIRLGRKFIGCDIDKESAKKATQRCEVDFASH